MPQDPFNMAVFNQCALAHWYATGVWRKVITISKTIVGCEPLSAYKVWLVNYQTPDCVL